MLAVWNLRVKRNRHSKQAHEVVLHLSKIQLLFMIMSSGLLVYLNRAETRGPARNRLKNHGIEVEFRLFSEASHGDMEMIAGRIQNLLTCI